MNMEDVMVDPAKLSPWPLPAGITSRFVDTSPVGLKFHILEAVPVPEPQADLPSSSFSSSSPPSRPPLILLLHGFPNLAYDWRYVMPKLANAGYYVVAFDLRGFGRTHNADLSPISESSLRPLVLVRDVVTLVHALGYTQIHTLVGHDLGAFAASIFTLVRNDMVKSLVLMAHPYGGPPGLAVGSSLSPSLAQRGQPDHPHNPQQSPLGAPPRLAEADTDRDVDIHASLLNLDPPRKHYKWYNSTPQAAYEWSYPVGQPLHDFLRGYFHLKSADHAGLIDPRPLKAWKAEELEIMPHYYIMLADKCMRGNVAHDMAQEPPEVLEKLSSTPWLPDNELAVYVDEFSRTTFENALGWYASLTNPERASELLILASAKLSVPVVYVSGTKDWGNFQVPGALEAMREGRGVSLDHYRGERLIGGAGHWVHMERPDETAAEILNIARSV